MGAFEKLIFWDWPGCHQQTVCKKIFRSHAKKTLQIAQIVYQL